MTDDRQREQIGMVVMVMVMVYGWDADVCSGDRGVLCDQETLSRVWEALCLQCRAAAKVSLNGFGYPKMTTRVNRYV